MVKNQLKKVLPFLLVLFTSYSCATLKTQVKHYESIEEAIEHRNFKKAVKEIEEAREKGKYKGKDRVLYYLDMGMALHNAGKYERSNEFLKRAEITIEENFTKSVSKMATSMLLNDNVLDYPGEDYEDIFTNIIKSLNYIHLGELEEAMVEVRRINMKLSKLGTKYSEMAERIEGNREDVNFKTGEVDLKSSKFGSFLSMINYLTAGKYDDALIDKRRIENEASAMIDNLLNDILKEPEKDNARFFPVCFIGKGPVKRPLVLSLDLDPGLDLGMITIPGEENKELVFKYEGESELHFKFAVPTITERESEISRVIMEIEDNRNTELLQLENFNKVAEKTFDVKKPIIYLRAGLRTFLKAMADKKAKEEIDKKTKDNELLGSLLKFAVDKTTDITENADLRCWRTMPSRVFVGYRTLPPGKYDIRIKYLNSNGSVESIEKFKNVTVTKNSLNLIEGVSYR